jgi:hypothetical protein
MNDATNASQVKELGYRDLLNKFKIGLLLPVTFWAISIIILAVIFSGKEYVPGLQQASLWILFAPIGYIVAFFSLAGFFRQTFGDEKKPKGDDEGSDSIPGFDKTAFLEDGYIARDRKGPAIVAAYAIVYDLYTYTSLMMFLFGVIIMFSYGFVDDKSMFYIDYYICLIIINGLSWLYIIGVLFPHKIGSYVAKVMENTAIVSIDNISNNLVSFASGLHLKYPWVEISSKFIFPLDILSEKLPDLVIPTKNGPEVIVHHNLIFRRDPRQMKRMSQFSEIEIFQALSAVITEAVSERISNEDKYKSLPQKLNEIAFYTTSVIRGNELLASQRSELRQSGYNPDTISDEDRKALLSLEFQFGIIINKYSITSLDFDERFQKSRDQTIAAAEMNEMIRAELDHLDKDGKLSVKDRMLKHKQISEIVLARFDEGTKIDIKRDDKTVSFDSDSINIDTNDLGKLSKELGTSVPVLAKALNRITRKLQ